MELSKYLDFLKELGDIFDQLTAVEQGKLQAVRQGDLDALNDCIRQEQALSLSLRGADRKREQLLQALGLGQVPLRQLPDHCPPDLRREARERVEDVLARYQVLSGSRDAARSLLECELHKLENQLRQRGVEPELDQRYQTMQGELPPRMRTDFHA